MTIPFEALGTPTGITYGFRAVWIVHGLLGTVTRFSAPVETIRPPFTVLGGGSITRGGIARGAGSIWVLMGDMVSRIDPVSRDITATVPAGNAPSAIAYGSGSVWVTNDWDATVTRIKPAKERFNPELKWLDVIRVGLHPNGIVVGGGSVWVADTGADSVSRINLGTLKPNPNPGTTKPKTNSSRNISVGKAPVGIAYGAGAVWVANTGDGTVTRIDPVSGKVIATIHLGNSQRQIAVGDGKVWVTVQSR